MDSIQKQKKETTGTTSKSSVKKNKVKVKTVFQTEACECGAACLSMILSYYGCDVPLEEIRYECGISRDGCTAKDLVLAGSHYGLKGHAYQVALEKLKDVPLPAVLHWNFQHFVVLVEVSRKGAVINDPAKGRRKVSWEEVDQNYTGICLTYECTPAFKKQEDENHIRNLVLSRLANNRKAVWYLLISGFLLMIPELTIPLISNLFIDYYFGSGTHYLLWLVFVMGFLYLYQLILTVTKSTVLDRLKIKMSASSGEDLLNDLFRLPMPYYEQRYSGELATRLESDRSANDFLTTSLIDALLDIVSAAACLVLMFLYNWELTMIGLAGTLISVALTGIMTGRIGALSMKKQQDKSTLSGVLCAGISASESIKACGVENEYATEILGRYANLTRTEQTLDKSQQIINAITPAVSALTSMIILIAGAVLAVKGELTIGMLSAFVMLLSAFSTPVNRLLGFSLSYENMKATFSRVFDITLAKKDLRFTGDKDPECENLLGGSIAVSHLKFGYNPNKPPVINDISFRVDAGSRIGIVGASGCGKSTLGKLLSGLITPWEGQLLFGDAPLEKIPDPWITGSIAYVSQEGDFFAGSIRDNITMWNTTVSESNLYRAIEDAQLKDLIARSKGGVDYRLVEGAKNISGGQRQRIQIARALLNDPSILVLDEATSAIDTLNEQKINIAIERRGCTCIIVAHRISTVRRCDLILVLDQGKIAEAGTHEQLIAKNGLYAELAAQSQ